MTIAGFDSIPPVTLDRHRKAAGTYNAGGTWVAGASTTEQVESVVHPVTAKTKLSQRMMDEIDGQRQREWIVLYSALDTYQEAREATQTEADFITYFDVRYEIKMVDNWRAGVLDHQKAIAVRVDTDDTD